MYLMTWVTEGMGGGGIPMSWWMAFILGGLAVLGGVGMLVYMTKLGDKPKR